MRIVHWRAITSSVGAAAALTFAQMLMPQVSAIGAEPPDYHVGSLQITQPWARATPKGASTAGAYMTVTNGGTTTQHLSCVSSDAAAQCQIHEMSMDGGVMKMRPVEGGLEIKAGETVTLKPGAYHVMLLDLKQPLEQGKTITATFKFDTAGTVQVEFPIAAIGAPAPGASAGGGQMMMQGPGMMQMHQH